MASIHRQQGSKCWVAHFTDAGKRRRARSTGIPNTPANRAKAQKVADAFESTYRARNVLKNIREKFSEIAAELDTTWKIPTVEEFFQSWLSCYAPRLAETTVSDYQSRFNDFLAFLTSKGMGGADVDMVTAEVAQAYRDKLLASVSTVTTNKAIGIMAYVFAMAMRKGYVAENYFEEMGTVLENDRSTKRDFSMDELKLILSHCDAEWRSMVIFGLYTGQRISDIAALTWRQIDFEHMEVNFFTKKTKRRFSVPISQALLEHIQRLNRGVPDAPIHPRALMYMEKNGGRSGTISRQFYEILMRCNLIPKKTHKTPKDEKATSKRTTNPISFHSLRHTANSWLDKVGASQAVRMEIIGHTSEAVNRGYLHAEHDAKKAALDKMPGLNELGA